MSLRNCWYYSLSVGEAEQLLVKEKLSSFVFLLLTQSAHIYCKPTMSLSWGKMDLESSLNKLTTSVSAYADGKARSTVLIVTAF